MCQGDLLPDGEPAHITSCINAIKKATVPTLGLTNRFLGSEQFVFYLSRLKSAPPVGLSYSLFLFYRQYSRFVVWMQGVGFE